VRRKCRLAPTGPEPQVRYDQTFRVLLESRGYAWHAQIPIIEESAPVRHQWIRAAAQQLKRLPG